MKSYLLRSTHNACLNAIKHQKVKAEHSEQTLYGSNEGEQRDLLEEEEFKLKVRSAVQTLPTQCKKIFLMSRIQGKKYQQIADELSLSVKTVENQMGKALRTLRDELKAEHKSTMRLMKSFLWFMIGVNVFSIVMK
ncbi:sigma-70 family RNA polymerase sigma factor [Salibacteraceae bacterium]|nr:sigma-70 family RNA polymerase sigma factor [Salibacteraceae bacterium]